MEDALLTITNILYTICEFVHHIEGISFWVLNNVKYPTCDYSYLYSVVRIMIHYSPHTKLHSYCVYMLVQFNFCYINICQPVKEIYMFVIGQILWK